MHTKAENSIGSKLSVLNSSMMHLMNLSVRLLYAVRSRPVLEE